METKTEVIKKKRGRPKLQKNINKAPKEKKKRGRKPKIKTPEEIKAEEESKNNTTKRKRGRKRRCEINNLNNINLKVNTNNESLSFSSEHTQKVTEGMKREEVIFGNLNIVVHAPKEVNTDLLHRNLKKSQTSIFVNNDLLNIESNESVTKTLEDKVIIKEESFVPQRSINLVREKAKLSNSGVSVSKDIEQRTVKVNRLNKKAVKKSKPKLKRQGILVKFKNILDKGTQWPLTSNLLCWYDCHPINGFPLPLPVKYDEKRERFKVKGLFCSWSCMISYAVKEKLKTDLIYLFRKKLNDKQDQDENGKLITVRGAPPREALKSFGGPLNIKEFRTTSKRYELSIGNMSMDRLDLIEIDKRKGLRRKKPVRLNTVEKFYQK